MEGTTFNDPLIGSIQKKLTLKDGYEIIVFLREDLTPEEEKMLCEMTSDELRLLCMMSNFREYKLS